MTDAGFALHPSIDAERLRADFARGRRVQIAPFLTEESAAALRAHLQSREDWRLILNAGDKVYEIDRSGQAALTAEQRAELERRVLAAAGSGFQYRFESIRVPDEASLREAGGTLLDRFALFMSSGPVLELLRTIVGTPDVSFADAQATQYGSGHFLTRHDDAVEGKNRRAAYVFGLTPDWRAEWGGLLMFHKPNDDIAEALLPRMNALNLFAVPSAHSVSYVNPAAPNARLSVTGWLRAQAG